MRQRGKKSRRAKDLATKWNGETKPGVSKCRLYFSSSETSWSAPHFVLRSTGKAKSEAAGADRGQMQCLIPESLVSRGRGETTERKSEFGPCHP